MDAKEAIEFYKDFLKTNPANLYQEAAKCAINALEKKISKKVRVNNDDWFCCRKCDDTFKLFDSFGHRNRFCGNCGQAIDWSDHPIAKGGKG